MRITFKRVEIHNFMSYADEVFDFDAHKGLNLIYGKNNDIPGAKNAVGKTQLLESLCFALFGQTRNNIKNVNIHNKFIPGKETRVVAYFSLEDIDYKIISGFNKYGSPYCNLIQISEGEDIDLTKSTIQETRSYLETELLHCDISIFLRTVILSSDQNYNFFRLRKGEKKEFIEKLFDISVFGDMYSAIHKDILTSDKELLAFQNKLLVLNNSYTEYKSRIEKYDADNESKIKQLNEKLDSLKLQHDKLKELNVSSNSSEVKKYEDAIDVISNAISEANSKKLKLNNDKAKLELAIHKLNASKDSKQKVIDKHSTLMNKLCNDCKKIFSDYYNITTYTSEIDNIIKQIAQLNAKIDETKNAASKYDEKLSTYENKIEKAQSKIKLLTEAFNKTSREISTLESNMSFIETQLNKIKTDVNPYTELFENNKKQIDEQTKQMEILSEKYKYLKFAENIVSQDTLRKFIIADLVGLLNNKIKVYLTKLGARYNVTFDSDMNYEFTTEGGTCEYDNFSAGERARLMIAACFAFRDFMYIRNNLSSNILILDEFIDGAIDSLAIESILEILKDFSTAWKQNIYVISHRREVAADVFDNIIQIVKTNNIAKITYL